MKHGYGRGDERERAYRVLDRELGGGPADWMVEAALVAILARASLEVEGALGLARPQGQEPLLGHNGVCHCCLHLACGVKAE